MFEHRSRDATAQDTNPLTPEEALRKARIALSRLIKRYQYGLERMPSSKIRDQSSLALVDTQIDGARYVLVKAPLALSRSLTGRQLEVALFAAEGLSNKEVGGRLSITAATVAAHLRVIYKKLNIGSRAGLLPALLHRDGRSRSKSNEGLAPSIPRAPQPMGAGSKCPGAEGGA